jgi:hypothetical protein
MRSLNNHEKEIELLTINEIITLFPKLKDSAEMKIVHHGNNEPYFIGFSYRLQDGMKTQHFYNGEFSEEEIYILNNYIYDKLKKNETI